MDHILVVDDDRDIRDLLSEYLQKQGYRVSAAADG
ncbi:MAG: DNA-binding response regulator, partial [Betaproteobacteria bacterium]